VHLDRQHVVRTRTLGTVRLQTASAVEATGTAVLGAHPEREEIMAGGTGMTDRRLEESLGDARTCHVLGHVDAAEL